MRAAPAGLALALAVLYPFAISGNQDLLDASIVALAYVIMALGLNIVVGFAGLLDLGYVAFYVIGAFVIAYLGSAYWANAGAARHRTPRGRPAGRARHPLQLPDHPRARDRRDDDGAGRR